MAFTQTSVLVIISCYTSCLSIVVNFLLFFHRGPDPVDCGTVKVMAWVNDTTVSLHNGPVCILMLLFWAQSL